MPDLVLTKLRDGVAIVTLNRPHVRNAWNRAMREDLVERLAALDHDPAVAAIVLTGAGEAAFGAGGDLDEARALDASQAEAWVAGWARLYDGLRSIDKPLVAALNGVAAGSAFQVALLADLRIAHPGVRMGQPEIDAGVASVIGPWLIREMLGTARAVELTLTGRLMDAEEALTLGLLNRVVPQAELITAAVMMAGSLATKPAVALRLTKRRFREMTEAGYRAALEIWARNLKESYASGEPQRMMEQFVLRRRDRHG